jgi:chemosensory pili system protein ChpA (sensor histidine kinase/response regulator)
MDAVAAYTDEIERQLAALEEPRIDVDDVIGRRRRACKKLVIFLDELADGEPPVPLKLFPEYERCNACAWRESCGACRLVLSGARNARAHRRRAVADPADKLASHLVKQRRTYERGLLAFCAATPMARARCASGLRHRTASSRQSARTFWWTVEAFFDAIVEGGLDPGFGPKQLAARIDLQIRRLVEGSAKVADRLRREVLYYVAVSMPVAAVGASGAESSSASSR